MSSTVSPSVRPRVSRRAGLVLVVLSAVVVLFAAACTSPSGGAEAPQHVVFMAGYRPQANLPFVAAYVAKDQGFFAAEGLDVEIQHASGADEHLKLLLDQRVQFVTATAPQALKRSGDGLPVVAVALFGQRGDQGFVARADAGINTPADFKGRTVGFKAGVVPAELDALLKTAGLTRKDVKLVSVGFDPREFIQGKVDIYPVFLDNEPDLIRHAGVAINVFDPQQYGVPTLGLTYLAHRDTLKNDPQLVERFLRATLRAVQWIDTHRDQAIDITLQYAPGADRAHQRFLLDADLANAARANGIGRGTTGQWQALADMLNGYGVLPHPVDAARAFDGRIVDRLYERGEIR